MSDGRIERSASTWQQPTPARAGPVRAALVHTLVEMIDGLGPRRLRVAIDGRTAAGKTSLGHELAEGLARHGRTVLRASLDDFKRPWSEAHLYDRLSGEGYYRNAFDLDAIRALLLEPASPSGDGRVALCSIDPLTQIDHSATATAMPGDGVLIVDGVFACRPEIDRCWDLRIWVEIDAELSVRRGTERDTDTEGGADAAEVLHRERYLAAEELYLEEVDPTSFGDVIVVNSVFASPRLVRPA
jgi:uridine kinase